ncbi:MAG: DUF4270 family protein [Alistipes sp.]|nr:DUF4270 family protein [Alistipes sp.]
MMSCKSLYNIALLLGAILMVVSCTTNVDYTMGEEFVPSNQNMELRRRVYQLDTWQEGAASEKCELATTRLYRSDSLRSSNIGLGLFGRETDATFGSRESGFMSQMVFSLSLPKERGWGYRPIFDSMTLSLCITNFHGDTTKKHRFEVYEIVDNDYLKLSADTTLYINFDAEKYISSEPIFTFEFPNQERGVYVGDTENPQNASVLLEHTPKTQEYVSRLMLTKGLNPDSLARDRDSLYVNGNELKFVDTFKGIYIAPAKDTEGAMFATSLSSTSMMLFSRGRYEEDPTIIRDTTYMIYNMYLDPATYTDVAAGNVSVNSISHDYEGSAIDLEAATCDVCYVEGMGGVVTELCFTDKFIQSLADIVSEAGADATVSVNQAKFSIYMEGSDYDYNIINPTVLTPLMDDAMLRMGMYVNFDKHVAIADYNYSAESSMTLSYDGYLNRSLGCYQMDISTAIQSLMLAAAQNLDAEGNVDLTKFAIGDTVETSGDYVNLRRIYIAPDATSFYGMKRQALYGMGGDAPVRLELTYTIVK